MMKKINNTTIQLAARLFALLSMLVLFSAAVSAKTLDIYFIDVEGGAATLIVTPVGESILIDSGFPGERDAGRIARVARDVAKVKAIDHYVTTHWHRDHVGGIPQLVQLIPVKRYYDHGVPTALAQDILPELIDPYKKTTDGKNQTLKAGDEIKLRNGGAFPRLRLEIVAGSGVVKGEPAGSPQIRVCNADQRPAAEDKTDNANSLGFVLTFGGFRFFDGGDLTWNVENKLVCPRDLVGMVDVYQVDHHGSDSSNNPSLVNSLKPRVAIIDNGPRKGGEVNTLATLKAAPGIEAIYQLHRNLATTANNNTMSGYIANEDENCNGNYIRLSVDEAARSYTVSIDAKQISRKYRVGSVRRN
jgi:beta-lactamase superfamily II metal-dependent hydrolase